MGLELETGRTPIPRSSCIDLGLIHAPRPHRMRRFELFKSGIECVAPTYTPVSVPAGPGSKRYSGDSRNGLWFPSWDCPGGF